MRPKLVQHIAIDCSIIDVSVTAHLEGIPVVQISFLERLG
jgi:hypothetical protein